MQSSKVASECNALQLVSLRTPNANYALRHKNGGLKIYLKENRYVSNVTNQVVYSFSAHVQLIHKCSDLIQLALGIGHVCLPML